MADEVVDIRRRITEMRNEVSAAIVSNRDAVVASRSVGNRANIFVISHKSDSMTDKFQNHIVFEKKNNFSRIK